MSWADKTRTYSSGSRSLLCQAAPSHDEAGVDTWGQKQVPFWF